MNDTEKTKTILDALKAKHCGWGYDRRFVMFPELRLGSGYADIAQRRIDLFTISSEKGNYTTAYEIKVSRGDFLKDIKDKSKQRGARLYSTNFYYVAPKGMIQEDEVPLWAGLLEYDFEEKRFNTKIVAPLQSRNTPSWGLVCSIVRRVNDALCRTKIEEQGNIIKSYNNELKKLYRHFMQIADKNMPQDKKDLIIQSVLNDPCLKVHFDGFKELER